MTPGTDTSEISMEDPTIETRKPDNIFKYLLLVFAIVIVPLVLHTRSWFGADTYPLFFLFLAAIAVIFTIIKYAAAVLAAQQHNISLPNAREMLYLPLARSGLFLCGLFTLTFLIIEITDHFIAKKPVPVIILGTLTLLLVLLTMFLRVYCSYKPRTVSQSRGYIFEGSPPPPDEKHIDIVIEQTDPSTVIVHYYPGGDSVGPVFLEALIYHSNEGLISHSVLGSERSTTAINTPQDIIFSGINPQGSRILIRGQFSDGTSKVLHESLL